MEFDAHRPIFLQIVDYLGEQILTGALATGERTPSARELAATLAVTPNTVVRACVLMQEQGVLENRRGVGYFVEDDARDRLRQLRKQRFIEEDLPTVFRTMQLVGLDLADLQQRYEQFLQQEGPPG